MDTQRKYIWYRLHVVFSWEYVIVGVCQLASFDTIPKPELRPLWAGFLQKKITTISGRSRLRLL